MSSFSPTEISSEPQVMENSNIAINLSNEALLQNHSSEVVQSQYSTSTTNLSSTSNSTLKMKSLPLVYIQGPYQSNNFINVNNISQLPTMNENIVGKSVQNIPMSTSVLRSQPNVIYTPIPRSAKPLVLKKHLSITPAPINEKFLSMLKPQDKTIDTASFNNLRLTEGLSLLNTTTTIQTSTPKPKIIVNVPKVNNSSTLNTTKLPYLPVKGKIINLAIPDKLQSDTNITPNLDENSTLECNEILENSPEKIDITLNNNILDGTTTITPVVENLSFLRDMQKFPKHGISILKKNYTSTDRKSEKPSSLIIIPNVPKSVSDYKESALTKPSEERIISTGSNQNNQKSTNRRKANVQIRKEYDDFKFETKTHSFLDINIDRKSFEKSDIILTEVKSEIKPEKPELKEEPMEIEIIKEKSVEDNEWGKLLIWENNIGYLPGSSLKFLRNEFNLIEYLSEEEYNKLVEKQTASNSKSSHKSKSSTQQEMRCLECGCYGMPSEFINPKFCSLDCQEKGNIKILKEKEKANKKKRKKSLAIKNDHDDLTENKNEEEEIEEENSQDKFLKYPWNDAKKGFNWSKYLDHLKAIAAPVKLFKDAFPYTRNGFRPGMKMEGVDPQHQAYFCVFTVAEANGYRLRLHFDGYPDNYDFWCNADSMEIFPIGWCEKYGHTLQPPSGYTVQNFNWVTYLKATKSNAAPKHLFCNRAGNAICPNGFRIGMKLEAVDRKNTSLVCVATVKDMMDNRLLIHFDSWDDIYDYWADPSSPYIHPVGWCNQYGHNLTPPNDYPNPESFCWEQYLKETKSTAAPIRAFKQRPACGFKRGMRLECVDKRVPQLIRVATVDDVKEHQIRIHFDGWPDRYSYWVDDDSPDIHPVGWCLKTGHALEPPLTPDDVYDFLECPTVGCRGQGDIRGPKFAVHSSQKYCPYAEENIDLEKILPDRLLSPDRTLEAVVPKEIKPKAKMGRPPKLKMEPTDTDSSPEKKLKKPHKKRKLEHKNENNVKEKVIKLIEDSNIIHAENIAFKKHSIFLKEFCVYDTHPKRWTKFEVAEFVSSIPGCQNKGDVFKDENVDGEALLMLSQKEILNILNIKMGPAIKLYNSILLLRQNFKGS